MRKIHNKTHRYRRMHALLAFLLYACEENISSGRIVRETCLLETLGLFLR